MAVNNDDAIKQIFSRCLLNCLHVPLWYVFLFYTHISLLYNIFTLFYMDLSGVWT